MDTSPKEPLYLVAELNTALVDLCLPGNTTISLKQLDGDVARRYAWWSRCRVWPDDYACTGQLTVCLSLIALRIIGSLWLRPMLAILSH